MENNTKTAAAISAVLQYIQTEEEAICIQALAAPPVEPVPAVRAGMAPLRLWGITGRQTQMQMRNLLQRRTFK